MWLQRTWQHVGEQTGAVCGNKIGGEKKTLSRDCDGCSQMKMCNRRYGVVGKGDKVYCPDGTAHLVDGL